ncbi:MAG: VOC family protein [Candidatus Binatia bacterium]
MITAVPRVAIAVRDMDRAIARFRDTLGMPVREFEWLPQALGIRMALCVPPGGAHVELMSPAEPERAHARSLLRFLDRRGEGLFALMLYAPDPNAEAEELRRRSLDVMPLLEDAEGRDLHPRNTCGVLIRIYPAGSAESIERELDRGVGRAHERRSRAGLSGITRVLVAVSDLDAAIRVYRDQLRIDTRMLPPDETSGVLVAACTPPSGATIDLVAPTGVDGPAGREITKFLRERGEGMYALLLESDDLEATVGTLEANGARPRRLDDRPDAWELDPETTQGARVRIQRRAKR